jgi:hypothetical protein
MPACLDEYADIRRKAWRTQCAGQRHRATGTISFAMDCGATSVEPFYSHVVYKKLAGGGTM